MDCFSAVQLRVKKIKDYWILVIKRVKSWSELDYIDEITANVGWRWHLRVTRLNCGVTLWIRRSDMAVLRRAPNMLLNNVTTN